MLTVLFALSGAVVALWQELRRRSLLAQRDDAIAAQAAAQEAHARAERVVEFYQSEIASCEEAIRASDSPDAVRDRLRDLLAGSRPADD